VSPSSAPRHAWRAFWAALGAALFVALFGVFGPHPGSIFGVRNKLTEDVERALAHGPAHQASVEMDGQTARLVGIAPTEEARAQAIRAAYIAAGPGGPWYGGVTRVVADDLVVGAPTPDLGWRATLREGRVILSGQVAATRIRRRLYDRARDVFAGEKVIDAMRVPPGAADAAWPRTAEDALSQLAKLHEGEVRMHDAHLVFVGDGDVGAVNEIGAYYRAHPSGSFQARLEVDVTGEGLGIADLGDLDLTRPSAATCQQAFDRMMDRNIISFREDTAEIDRSSQRLLNQLASIAIRCDAHAIEIGAHTDNAAPREVSIALSQARARAISESLAGQGVARRQLHAVGYGPDRPLVPNDTAVGRAANRRIEFKIRG